MIEQIKAKNSSSEFCLVLTCVKTMIWPLYTISLNGFGAFLVVEQVVLYSNVQRMDQKRSKFWVKVQLFFTHFV